MNKVAFTFDPFDLIGKDPPIKGARQAKEEIAKYIVDQVIEYCGDGKSPVAGGAWKRSLSAAYRKFKLSEGGNGFADLILTGDLLQALDCVVLPSGELELRVKGREAGKADGHNNHSGDSRLPTRKFIPEEGETFKRPILDGIKAIAEDYFRRGD